MLQPESLPQQGAGTFFTIKEMQPMGWTLKTRSLNIAASYTHPAVARRDVGCPRVGGWMVCRSWWVVLMDVDAKPSHLH